MRSNVLGIKNGVHIIDSRKTSQALHRALNLFYQAGKDGKKILFVGTNHQVSSVIEESAKKCGQYYVNEKWLGGMLTNWYTVSKSIKTLLSYDKVLSDTESGLTKKEILYITKKRKKLMSAFSGILNMKGRPDIVFVSNTTTDHLAVREAISLGITVVAIVDTNAKIKGINYPIPGNDDSMNAMTFYCEQISNAILSGVKDNMKNSGIDIDSIVKKGKEEEKEVK